jgi:hypothetical protein
MVDATILVRTKQSLLTPYTGIVTNVKLILCPSVLNQHLPMNYVYGNRLQIRNRWAQLIGCQLFRYRLKNHHCLSRVKCEQ